jgi:signal transduction histidine kinase
VILMTGEPNVESASEAVRLGAYDYLSKPVSKPRLLDTITRATRHVELLREKLRAEESERRLLENLAQIGENSAMLAHEIKSPVSSVNLALRAVADQLGEDHQAVLGELFSKMQRLEKTLLRMLQFVKPMQGQREPVRLATLFGGLGRHLDGELADVPFDWKLEPESLRVFGDPQLLDQLLGNLVRNAAKALLEHAQERDLVPQVRLHAELDAQGRCLLRVEDNGPGIPRESWKDVFRPFFSKSEGGTGLGLAICKKIADVHGAAIELGESSLGGAEFLITLPPESVISTGNPS